VIDGVNTKTELFRWPNSWGTRWARNGYAWLTFKDVERLLQEDGEAAAPTEQTPIPQVP
jgi:C1A family cysteine protease